MFSSNLFRSSRQAFVAYVGLFALGLIGNLFKYPIFFNVDFLFGSVFAMLALQLFGLGLGTVAALLIACVTIFHWGHPYAVLIMTMEVAFTGWLSQRYKLTLVLANTIYWVCIGMPLVFALYHGVMDLALNATMLAMTKQAVNGIANTLLARLLYFVLQYWRRADRISFRDLLCHLLLLFALLPALILVILGAKSEFDESEQQIRASLRTSIRHAASQLEFWLVNGATEVAYLASLASGMAAPEMQARLIQAQASDRNFLRIGLHDKDAVIIAHSNPIDDLGKSLIGLSAAHRNYFPKIKQAREPLLSEVYMSMTGTPQPLVSVLAPVLRRNEFNGFVIGILSLKQIEHMLAQIVENDSLLYTLVDQNKRIILSNHPNHPLRNRMELLAYVDRPSEPGANGVALKLSPLQPNRPASQRWKNATYFTAMTIGQHADWELILEQPVAPFRLTLSSRFARALATLLGLVVLVLLFAEYLSRKVSATTEALSALTQDMASALEQKSTITWPESVLHEPDRLILHFRKMFSDLQTHINVNRQLQMSLEERVAQRTLHLEEAQEIAHLGSWAWDIASGKIYWSNEQFRIFGYAPGAVSLSYDIFFDALLAEDRAPVQHAMDEAIARNVDYHVECRIKRPDGIVRNLLLQGNVLHNTADKPMHMTGTVFDITERKQAEQALWRESEKNLMLLGNASDGIVILNEEARIIEVSDSFCTMLGYTRDELMGMHVSQWDCGFDSYAETMRAFQAQFINPMRTLFESRHRRKDGSTYEVEISGYPLKLDGKPVVFNTSRDISERKETQRCLNELNASLEDKIVVRTRQLQELALQLTLTEERERGILAQELHDNHGQLLAILRIKLSKLEESKDHAELMSLAENAEQSARMVLRMLSPPSLSLTTLMQALQWLAQEVEQSYGLTVHLVVEGQQPEFSEAIKAILLRSVRELLVNVVKHARVSSADLTYLGDEDQLRLVVGDDGCGFVPFDYAAVLPGQRSFGLSSIAQRFASIGGQMLIDSSPGGGTTVTLSLPWSIAMLPSIKERQPA